jgi:serine/threonine protein kinase
MPVPPSGGMPFPGTPPAAGGSGLPPVGVTGRLPANLLLNQRYIILEKIGQGGMAAVYKASDTWRPGMIWAIKEMSDAALKTAEERDFAVRNFLQEANLLRTLDHPNLPKVIDGFTESGKHYLVMEFVPGKSFEALIETRQQPFTEREVYGWALQLCDVLGYLHNQKPKIIFRDLKPSNIMLTPNGQIKLIDFGIVRFFKPGKTRDTQALGTPGYSALEATTGQTDERSDLYSLCVTLHQMLTLNDPVTTMYNHPPVRKLNPQVSGDLERILAKGLQNQRDARWNSVAEMRTELSRMSSAPPLPGFPPGSTAVGGVGAWSAGYPYNAQPSGPASSGGSGTMPSGSVGGWSGSTMPSGAPGGWSAGGYPPAQVLPPTVVVPSNPPARPTTRLLQVAVQLSAWQFALIILGIVLILVVATYLLAPVLDDVDFNWNRIPIIALFGVLGYTAYPKRGAALATFAVLTLVLSLTIIARLGDQGYPIWRLFLAVGVSAVFMELWLLLLPRVKGKTTGDHWGREVLWLALMAMIAIGIFNAVLFRLESGFDPLRLGMAVLFGVIGWFIGDFIRQYVQYRKTGIRSRP